MEHNLKLIFIFLFTLFILSICHNVNSHLATSSRNDSNYWSFAGNKMNGFPITANRVIKNLRDPVTHLKIIPSQDTLYYYLQKVYEAGFNLVTVNLTPANNSLTKQDEYYKNFFDALQKINSGYSKKLRCIVYDSRIKKLAPEALLPFILKFYNRDEVYGFSYDEPRYREFDMVKSWKESIDSLNQLNLLKNKLFYVNLFGIKALKDYRNYVYSFLNMVNPQVLSFDHYPLWDEKLAGKYGYSLNSDWINDYFLNFEFIRQTSLSSNIPFFNWVLIHKHWSDYSNLFYRRASEGDLIFQVYSSLAYGSKGIFYYNFWNQNHIFYDNGWNEEEGILDYNLVKTEIFSVVSNLNNQISRLSDILLQLKSTGVYHKNENYYNNSFISDGSLDVKLEQLYDSNSDRFEKKFGIKLIEWNDSTELPGKDLSNKFIHDIDNSAALAGLFEGKDNSDYFMLVNKNRNSEEQFEIFVDPSKLTNENATRIIDVLSNSEIINTKSMRNLLKFSISLSPGSGKLFTLIE